MAVTAPSAQGGMVRPWSDPGWRDVLAATTASLRGPVGLVRTVSDGGSVGIAQTDPD